jgi:hypothetical protein
VHFEVDGTAESEHGVVGDVDDGDDQVDRSAAGIIRFGSGYWISIKVFKVLHFGSLEICLFFTFFPWCFLNVISKRLHKIMLFLTKLICCIDHFYFNNMKASDLL